MMYRPAMPNHEVAAIVPEHLRELIVEQDYALYTPMDHALWRFVMRLSRAFFSKNAHPIYLEGLNATGILTERIPRIAEMDEKLKQFGWRAAGICGFIPPAAFMEFLSRGILPIACDIRQIGHLSYTPAPDIIHEAAGHAPILADPAFAQYLRKYGELAEKAIMTRQDLDVYEAVRHLSDIKEDPASTEMQVHKAQLKLDETLTKQVEISEATQLSRMGWWTFEYGLLGDEKNPQVYGAGLLSSMSESFHCFSTKVRKVPFSVACVDQGFDITRPQPQLFVARSFAELERGLEDFAKTMAFRLGGKIGLEKAIRAETVTATVLDSGVEVGGRLTQWREDVRGDISFVKYTGPVQIAHKRVELENQGPAYHLQGFSSPVGCLASGKNTADLNEVELKKLASEPKTRLEFRSGIVVEGKLFDWVARDSKILLLRFNECTVRWGTETLYQPDWGIFDMLAGARIVSVYGGAPDRCAYARATGGFGQTKYRPKSNLTDENRELNRLYQQVRKLRENLPLSEQTTGLAVPRVPALQLSSDLEGIEKISAELDRAHRHDWLLRYEIVELLDATTQSKESDKINIASVIALKEKIQGDLLNLRGESQEQGELIERGLAVLGLHPEPEVKRGG